MAEVLSGLPDGQRDEGLFRAACSLRNKFNDDRRLVDGAILDLAARCVHPFPVDQALAKVESAFKQEQLAPQAVLRACITVRSPLVR